MVNIALLVVIIMTWLLAIRKYGPFSVVMAGVFGFTMYSAPAVLGISFKFQYSVPYSGETDPLTDFIMLIAWTVFFLTLYALSQRKSVPQENDIDYRQLRNFSNALVILSLLGFSIIAIKNGPLYFLQPRDTTTASLVITLWRWTNTLGLISAVLTRAKLPIVIFSAGVFVHFIAGDRTMFAITAVALLIAQNYRQTSFFNVVKLRYLALLSILAFLVIFGKQIYILVKTGSVEIFVSNFSWDAIIYTLSRMEPVVTYNLLDFSVREELSMRFFDFWEGMLGNIFIFPSLFGVNTNQFNEFFTQSLPISLTWGVAGNIWAHAWVAGGFVTVVFFAMGYAYVLRKCNQVFLSARGAKKIIFLVLGSLFAVYLHRNGFDNMLSFVRQIVVVSILAVLTQHLLSSIFNRLPKKRP